jgi:dihydrofolate synthase/folylpolyglutamate synthase
MALRYFAEQKCDLVIWETGLGGRLDATNIVTPLASVITNIAFDHEKWLGHTLAEIAREKAGIIKAGVPVVTATDAPEALAIIEETASRLKAPLTRVGQASSLSWPGETIALPLLGDHQLINAALAAATVGVLQNKIPVTEEAICIGLKTVQWPGRLQVAKREHQTLLLDGAHNPAGVATLRAALEKHFPGTRPAMILGCLADKDWPQMCRMLAPLADAIFLARVQSMRTAAPQEMAEVCRRENPSARVEACATLSEALRQAAAAPFLVVTGSLHFIGEALELLRLSAGTESDERGLNEWQTASERYLVAP